MHDGHMFCVHTMSCNAFGDQKRASGHLKLELTDGWGLPRGGLQPNALNGCAISYHFNKSL